MTEEQETSEFKAAVHELLADEDVIRGAANSTAAAVKYKRVMDLLQDT